MLADPMAAEFPDDREAMLLGVGLYGMTDIAQGGARFNDVDALPQNIRKSHR